MAKLLLLLAVHGLGKLCFYIKIRLVCSLSVRWRAQNQPFSFLKQTSRINQVMTLESAVRIRNARLLDRWTIVLCTTSEVTDIIYL